MTTAELYYNFHLLVNKNATNDNINIEKGNYVNLFNRESKKWLSTFIRTKNSNNEIIYIQNLLVSDQSLSSRQVNQDFISYGLPDDYFEFVGSYSIAEKEGCTNKVYNYLTKPKDLSFDLNDTFSQPSFEFSESLCNISNKKLIIYINDYKLNTSYLSYYKKLGEIDMEGYTRIDGNPSTTINPDLDDYCLNQINDQIVIEVMRQFENPNGFQLSKERTINN